MGCPGRPASRRRLHCCTRSSDDLAFGTAPYPVAMGPEGGASRPVRERLIELLEWPRGLARLAAAACSACAVAVLVYEVPHTISTLGDEAGSNAALSFADREIGGGNSIVVDQVAAYEARALIPPGTPYRVVLGPNLKGATPLTVPAVSSWMTYFLMPRRQTGDASWIICYGCDTSKLGAYHKLWQDDNGISIGELS